MTSNESKKQKALTELFLSNTIQQKITGMCYRHYIPMNADIQNDILMVTFENLQKYNTGKFVEAYESNPKRIVALAVRIALTKGIYKDKRIPSGFNHTIAQQILHASTFNSKLFIGSSNDDDEKKENSVLKNLCESVENIDEIEEENIKMWQYVKQNLTVEENELLNIFLQPIQPKLKGEIKKKYNQLLPRMKNIITEFKNIYND